MTNPTNQQKKVSQVGQEWVSASGPTDMLLSFARFSHTPLLRF